MIAVYLLRYCSFPFIHFYPQNDIVGLLDECIRGLFPIFEEFEALLLEYGY